MGNFIMGIISMTVSTVILATVFISSVKNTSTCYGNCSPGGGGTSWTGAELAMWSLITLVAIVGMVYGVLNVFGLA